MSSVNKVILVGRLGSDPEKRYSQAGKAVTKFSLTTDNGYGENKQTDWHRVTTFDKVAEACADNLSKGRLVYLEGRISYNKWEKDDGTVQFFTDIIANQVQFLPAGDRHEGPRSQGERRDERRGSAGNDRRSDRGGGSQRNGASQGGHDDWRDNGFADKDIPF